MEEAQLRNGGVPPIPCWTKITIQRVRSAEFQAWLWGQRTHFRRGWPVLCTMFSSITGLYSLDAGSTFPGVTIKCLQTLSHVPWEQNGP